MRKRYVVLHLPCFPASKTPWIPNLVLTRNPHAHLTSSLLTPRENEHLGAGLGALAALTVEQEVLLHFSLKEAVYKAIDPFLQRHVGWQVRVRVEGWGWVRFRHGGLQVRVGPAEAGI